MQATACGVSTTPTSAPTRLVTHAGKIYVKYQLDVPAAHTGGGSSSDDHGELIHEYTHKQHINNKDSKSRKGIINIQNRARDF